jgi:hypothetical protein
MEGEQEQIKTPLEIFREEIGEKIRQEVAGEVSTGNFLKIEAIPERQAALNPQDLTEADRVIYEEIKAGTLTDEKWQEYEKNLQNDFMQARQEKQTKGETLTAMQFPRYYVRAYLNNLRK